MIILFSSLLISFAGFAQTPADDETDQGGKLQERMREYIQRRLNLSRSESEKFSPIFMRYLLDLRRTHREFKTDPLVRQTKIAELRLRYRGEFRQVLDEKRANQVFQHQKAFEDKVIEEIKNRRQENRFRPRTRAVTL